MIRRMLIAAAVISATMAVGTARAQHGEHHSGGGGTEPARMECAGGAEGMNCCGGQMSMDHQNGMGGMMSGGMMGSNMMSGGMGDHGKMMKCMKGNSGSHEMGSDMKMCCGEMKDGEMMKSCMNGGDDAMKCCKHKKTDHKEATMNPADMRPSLK